MVKFEFRGVVACSFTPFNSDKEQSLNLSVIPEIAEYFNEAGYSCVLINGSHGEGMSMTVDERIQVAEAWAEVIKKTKQQLIVQVGGTTLHDVKKLARHAQNINAAAILCLPEVYYKPKTVEEVIDYLKEVGEAAPNTPLLYYHTPLVTGVAVSMAELLAKVKDQVPSLCGVKFSIANLDDLSQAIRYAGDKFKIIVAGPSNHNLPLFMEMGLDTFMPTSVSLNASYVKEIYDLMTKGRRSEAEESQKRFSNFIHAIAALNNGNVCPPMKAVATRLTKINLGPPRKPLPSFETPEGKLKIAELLANTKF